MVESLGGPLNRLARGRGVDMGTWDSGNFDGDNSRDFLADMVARWERMIDQCFAGEPPEEVAAFRFAPGFETLDGAIMPAVEILLAVAEKLPCDHLPGADKVAHWSSQALRIYDSEIDRWDPDEEFKVERRSVIAATFDRLAALAAERTDDAEPG